MGWAPPCGGGLVHALDGQYLLSLRVEKKLPPPLLSSISTLKKSVWKSKNSKATAPGASERKKSRGRLLMSFYPRPSPSKKTLASGWIRKNHWLVIDAASAGKSDEVIGMLAKVLDPLPVQSLFTELSPAQAMTDWLVADEPPANFSIDQDTELLQSGGGGATIRYIKQTPEHDDVNKHIGNGKICTKLAMTWADRISFVLDSNLNIKRIRPLDILTEGSDFSSMDDTERFDADMTLMCAELTKMLDDLVLALGGEKRKQDNEQKAA